MPAKYYNVPIGAELKDDESWTIKENENYYAGIGFEAFAQTLKDITNKEMIVFMADLSLTYYLLEGVVDFNCKVENSMDENKIMKTGFDNITLRSATDYCGYTDLSEWALELGLDEDSQPVDIIVEGVRQGLEEYKYMYRLPKTQTGRIRKMLEQLELKNEYKKLQLDQYSYDLYSKLYRGGLCDISPGWTYEPTKVWAYDIKSSYPYEMMTQDFPMSKMTVKTNVKPELLEYYNKYLWVAQFEFEYVKPKCGIDFLKIEATRYPVLTKVDYEILKMGYDFKIKRLPAFGYHAIKGKLWEPLRELIKTQFDIKENEPKGSEAYKKAKILLNSIFGLFTQDPLRYNKTLEEANNKMRPWVIGLWTASYGRYDLMRMLYKAGPRAIYWDTDSIKSLKPLTAIIEAENAERAKLHPTLGKWELEEEEVSFVGYGCKQYIQNGIVKCSGLNSKRATQYLKMNDIDYTQPIVIPAKYSGRYKIEDKKKIGIPFTIGGQLERELDLLTYIIQKGDIKNGH